MKKIISLLPSATEIVCALGLQESLVGRSHECDFPSGVEKLPVVTTSKVLSGDASKKIQQNVQELVSKGLSVYHVNGELLKKIKPDVIITQTHCEVCAVSEQEIEKAIEEFLDYKPQLITLKPTSLSDIFYDIYKIADKLEVRTNADVLVKKLQRHLEDINQLTRPLKDHPTLACIEWIDPIMTAGNWVPQMVEIAGGFPVLANADERSATVPYYDLQESDPDFILIMPCGFPIEQSLSEMKTLKTKPGWNTLRAVRMKNVFIADGNHFFNRPGPRLTQSVEILAEMLHPDIFNFGHLGKHFIRLE